MKSISSLKYDPIIFETSTRIDENNGSFINTLKLLKRNNFDTNNINHYLKKKTYGGEEKTILSGQNPEHC